MATDPAPHVLRWVQEGERLFGQVLHTLHRFREVEARADALEKENQQLRDEVQALRGERLEAAEALKAFAEHVTQVATLALQRLGKRNG
jgi:hypothetical protein